MLKYASLEHQQLVVSFSAWVQSGRAGIGKGQSLIELKRRQRPGHLKRDCRWAYWLFQMTGINLWSLSPLHFIRGQTLSIFSKEPEVFMLRETGFSLTVYLVPAPGGCLPTAPLILRYIQALVNISRSTLPVTLN